MNVTINMKIAISNLQPNRKKESVQKMAQFIENYLLSIIDIGKDNGKFAHISGNGITDFLQIEVNKHDETV